MCTVLSQLIKSLPITTVEPILLATACHPPCITGTADLHMCIKSESMHTFTQKPYKAGAISLLLLRSLFISCNSSYTSSCRKFLAPCLPWKCQKGELSNATLQEDELCTCQAFRTPVTIPSGWLWNRKLQLSGLSISPRAWSPSTSSRCLGKEVVGSILWTQLNNWNMLEWPINLTSKHYEMKNFVNKTLCKPVSPGWNLISV